MVFEQSSSQQSRGFCACVWLILGTQMWTGLSSTWRQLFLVLRGKTGLNDYYSRKGRWPTIEQAIKENKRVFITAQDRLCNADCRRRYPFFINVSNIFDILLNSVILGSRKFIFLNLESKKEDFLSVQSEPLGNILFFYISSAKPQGLIRCKCWRFIGVYEVFQLWSPPSPIYFHVMQFSTKICQLIGKHLSFWEIQNPPRRFYFKCSFTFAGEFNGGRHRKYRWYNIRLWGYPRTHWAQVSGTPNQNFRFDVKLCITWSLSLWSCKTSMLHLSFPLKTSRWSSSDHFKIPWYTVLKQL